MPLQTAALKEAIKTALTAQGTKGGEAVKDQAQGIEEVSAALARAIDAFVRSGDVVTEVGTTTADIDSGGDVGIGTGKGAGLGKVI